VSSQNLTDRFINSRRKRYRECVNTIPRRIVPGLLCASRPGAQRFCALSLGSLNPCTDPQGARRRRRITLETGAREGGGMARADRRGMSRRVENPAVRRRAAAAAEPFTAVAVEFSLRRHLAAENVPRQSASSKRVGATLGSRGRSPTITPRNRNLHAARSSTAARPSSSQCVRQLQAAIPIGHRHTSIWKRRVPSSGLIGRIYRQRESLRAARPMIAASRVECGRAAMGYPMGTSSGCGSYRPRSAKSRTCVVGCRFRQSSDHPHAPRPHEGRQGPSARWRPLRLRCSGFASLFASGECASRHRGAKPITAARRPSAHG